MGDLIGGKEESRLLLNFLIRLESRRNRPPDSFMRFWEIMTCFPIQGELSRMSRAERKLFKKFPVPGAPSLRGKDAFRGNSITRDGLVIETPSSKLAIFSSCMRAWIAGHLKRSPVDQRDGSRVDPPLAGSGYQAA